MEDVWCLEVHKDPSNHSEEGLCFVLAFPYKVLNLVPALEDNPTQFNMNIRLGCSFDYTLLAQLLTILSHLFLSCCCLGAVQWGCCLSEDLQHIGDCPKQILSKTRKTAPLKNIARIANAVQVTL